MVQIRHQDERDLWAGLPDGLLRLRAVRTDDGAEGFLIVDANPAMARLLGLQASEIAGRHLPEALPDLAELAQEWLSLGVSNMREGAVDSLSRLLWSAGRWFEIGLFGGRESEYVLQFHDITAQRKYAEALALSEQRYRSLFEQSLDAVFLVSADGNHIQANQAWLDMFRGTREDLARVRAIDIYADPGEREHFLRQMTETGRVEDVIRFKRFDGTVFDCERRVVALKDDAGELVGYLGLHRNITAQLQAERGRRESEANLRALLDATTDGACLLDLDGNILALNEEMARRLRTTPQQLLGRCIWEVFPAEVASARKQQAEEVVRSGRPVRFEDMREGRWILNTFWPVLDAKGEVIRLAGFGRDITDERRSEQELRDSREELRLLTVRQQEVREQERLGISRELHDQMGQHLAVLKMDLHRARKRLGEGVPVEAAGLTRMIDVVDRMARDVRRISSDLRPGLLDDFGLVAAVEWQLSQFQAHTGIACRLEVDMNDETMDRALSTALFRVFQELLTNVARHAGATLVHAGLAERDGQYMLTVSDDGRGITPSEQQSHTSLGLIGIRERMRPYGGRLEYECPATGGAVARVYVPMKRAASDSRPADGTERSTEG